MPARATRKLRSSTLLPGAAFMSLIESLQWRYATKKFDPDKVVPEDQLEQILVAGNLAPTSYGLQPFRFIAIRNQALQDQLVECSFHQQQVADASHVIVVATRTDLDATYVNRFASHMESVRSLPEGSTNGFSDRMVGIIDRMSASELDHWNAKQAYIALGMMMTAAAVLGIDSCPMEGFVPDRYDEILGLNELQLRSVVALPIGYRADDDDAQHLKKVRWPLSEMVIRM